MGGEQRVARRVRVSGKVRDVGYLFFARTCAEALGVTGWAADGGDGTVEVHAEGLPGQLAEFEFDLRRGARFARVESVDSREVSLEGLDDFRVRR
jgi:acylphosphatase